MSFKLRVENFIGSLHLSSEDKQEIRKEIVKFVLHIQDGSGSIRLRTKAYRKNILEDVLFFKSQYLDVSHYVHRTLWKSVVEQLNSNSFCSEDVEYCCSLLDQQELEKVKKIVVNQNFNIDALDITKWKMGKTKRRDLVPHIKTKVSALNFISKYDPALTQADFAQELACEAIKVFNLYPRSKGLNASKSEGILQSQVEMYMEKALTNKVKNLDYYYSCDSRKRVGNTNSKTIKKKKKLEKHLFIELLYHTVFTPVRECYRFLVDGEERLCKIKEKKVFDSLKGNFMDISCSPFRSCDPEAKEQMMFYSDKPFSLVGNPTLNSKDDSEAKELFEIAYSLLFSNGMDKVRAYQILKRRFIDQILDKRLLQIKEKYFDEKLEAQSHRKRELISNIFERYKDHPIMKEYLETKVILGTRGDYYTNVSSLSAEIDGKQKHFDVSDEDQAEKGFINISAVHSNENYIWYNNLVKKVENLKVELFLEAITGHDDDFNDFTQNKHFKTPAKWCQAAIDFYQLSEKDFIEAKSRTKHPRILAKLEGEYKYSDLTNNLMAFVDVIVGGHNEGFEKWLEIENRSILGGMSVSLINYAKRYFKITKSSITNNKIFKKVIEPELLMYLDGRIS